ncbi:MAG TPA: single-stranded DNA-binding protein [Bacteroidales bacterium]|nr:single-stranded DNA-binding protein [Bacteroidales bacterium]
MSINKVILVGHVGKDPVIRYFDKGVAKATFPLATSESYTNQQGETITSTEWHNIVLWRALAEVAEKTVKKGSQLYIVGKIKTRSYVDKDGVNKYITEILADTLLTLEKKQAPSAYSPLSGNAGKESQPDNSAGSVINEPVSGYQPSDSQPDDFVPGNSRTEDDLPF